MKGKWTYYSARETAWIKRMRRLPRKLAWARFCEVFGRTDVNADNFKSLCTRRGWRTGRDGCFKPGLQPWNTGKKMAYNANSARTRFKKGGVPPNAKYLGYERRTKDGYIEVSVAETNPHTGYERRFVLKHRRLWEQKNGPVPRGMCLKAIDGNRLNTDPVNWELIPRSILLTLNRNAELHYDSAAPEIRPSIMAIAKLKHARFAAQRRVRK